MKKVTRKEWLKKANAFQDRIKKSPYPTKLNFYRDLLDMVHVGESVLDVGCGDCHVLSVLEPWKKYTGIDPFPRNESVIEVCVEMLNYWKHSSHDTVICFAALDNVLDLELALNGMLKVAKQNVVIYTGIGIDPDNLHTLRIEKTDLFDVLGMPKFEKEISKNVFLFDFDVRQKAK